MPPVVYLLAGPNGVGKSTAAYELIPAGTEQINPDDIARQFRQHHPLQEVVLQHTNDEARRRMEAHQIRQESFGVETNLYDQNTWQYFMAFQQQGYRLDLLFLCTSRLETLIERVQNRHAQGGHFVRPDVIRERYHQGLFWLNQYFDRPDSVTLLDTGAGLVPVYQRINGEVAYQAEVLPEWVTKYLGHWFGLSSSKQQEVREASSVSQVRELYEKLKTKPSP
jgi:predicted ABC-type ATPase